LTWDGASRDVDVFERHHTTVTFVAARCRGIRAACAALLD
jgi:hypothetical protein